MDNSSAEFNFILTLFEYQGNYRYVFFCLSLLLYTVIIAANVTMIRIICQERSLHQPMFIFISCLSVNSIYGTASFFPRFMVDLLSDTHLICRAACFTQMYVIYTYASYELTVLSAMAYDRYVAICKPLHYHSIMTRRLVCRLLAVAWCFPACTIGFCLYLSIRLPLCGNEIPRAFCTNWPVVKLSCVDTTINNIAGMLVTATTVLLPLAFVLYTYLRILIVCRRSSSAFRGKAFQTCLPHMVTFVNYSITLFCEVSLSRYEYHELNPIVTVILSIEFLVIPPILNPLVYGLNLPQIRGRILRYRKKQNKTKQKKGFRVV